MRKDDLTGRVFGRLTVNSFSHILTAKRHWSCICSCGNTVIVAAGNLTNGHTKSCGCLQIDLVTKHGESQERKISKEYRAFTHIKERCYKPNTKGYDNYGGRGIKMCDRWLQSFESFLADVGRAPSPKHTIDRVDNNGNYEPGNCRWATRREQQNNRRRNKMITYNGKTQSLGGWCFDLNLNYSTIKKGLRRMKRYKLNLA
jgi:hypothetical protein